MSKDHQTPCHYEWTFQKPRNIGILPTGGSYNYNLPTNPHNNPALKTTTNNNKNEANQHIPYSGPTLWNPRYHQRSPDKFLTLTPLRPSQKAVESTSSSSIPVISITPRKGSREFSFFGGNEIKNNNSGLNSSSNGNDSGNYTNPITNLENHDDLLDHEQDPDDQLQNLSTDEIMDKLGFMSIHPKKKKDQVVSSIFPDVYALVRSPRRVGNNNNTDKSSSQLEKITNRRKERYQNTNNIYQSSSTIQNSESVVSQFGRSRLPVIPGITTTPDCNINTSKIDSNSNSRSSLHDKNIQDQGTLYSRQQDVSYRRITREPTVIKPAPSGGYRYVFPYREKQQLLNSVGQEENLNLNDENNLLNPNYNSASLNAQYHRKQLKDRRNYIRWNVHRSRSKNVNLSNPERDGNAQNVVENQEMNIISDRPTAGKEEKLRAISEKLQAIQRKNNRNNLETSSSTKRRIAAHFCDVLGQKSCQRCQEFYAKNYQIPPKESTEKIRSVSPLTRENTLTMPTVGLQKVVIRIKDESGRMEIANEEINTELL